MEMADTSSATIGRGPTILILESRNLESPLSWQERRRYEVSPSAYPRLLFTDPLVFIGLFENT